MDALDGFLDSIREVDTLVGLLQRSEIGESDATRNAVARGAIVLLVSHFETFVKDVLEEFSVQVSEAELRVQDVPLGLREISTLPILEEIISSKNDQQRTTLLQRYGERSHLWLNGKKLQPRMLDVKKYRRSITNVNPDSVDSAFAVVGVRTKPCDGMIDVPRSGDGVEDGEPMIMNIRFSLQSVVQLRNNIAHGDVEEKPTPEDVERNRRFLETFSKRLSRQLDSHLADVLSRVEA